MNYSIFLEKESKETLTEGLLFYGETFEALSKTQIAEMLHHALGYVDFTDEEKLSEMISNKSLSGDTTYDVVLASYNVAALDSGFKNLSKERSDFSDDEIASMLSYGLGFVDFSDQSVLDELVGFL